MWKVSSCFAMGTLAFLLIVAGSKFAPAQALNWEGQTGVFVTPLAYTVSSWSSSKSFTLPAVSYHYLDGGVVLGGFHQISITEGALGRIEFGYTRTLQSSGSTPPVSGLWGNGFNTFHGKVNLVREKATDKNAWLPAFSMGFVARTNVHNVTGALQNKNTNNADFYAVATKTLPQIPQLPIVLNFGFKVTNASIMGIAGNAPAYQGRLFGAAAFAIKGPAHSTLMLGSEALQEPRSIEGLPGAVIPTTITYALRIVPSGTFPKEHGWGEDRPRLNIDFGITQAAGNIAPGVNLQARHQFAFGISYGFQ